MRVSMAHAEASGAAGAAQHAAYGDHTGYEAQAGAGGSDAASWAAYPDTDARYGSYAAASGQQQWGDAAQQQQQQQWQGWYDASGQWHWYWPGGQAEAGAQPAAAGDAACGDGTAAGVRVEGEQVTGAREEHQAAPTAADPLGLLAGYGSSDDAADDSTSSGGGGGDDADGAIGGAADGASAPSPG